MPHPKSHLKLTGDTHPPEVEDEFDMEDDRPQPRPQAAARYAGRPGINPQQGAAMVAPRPAPIPYAKIGLTLAGMYLLARLLRL